VGSSEDKDDSDDDSRAPVMVCRVEPQHRCASGEAWDAELLLGPRQDSQYIVWAKKGKSPCANMAGSPGNRTPTVLQLQDKTRPAQQQLFDLALPLAITLSNWSLLFCEPLDRGRHEMFRCCYLLARHTVREVHP
jgi:hypothetical protein